MLKALLWDNDGVLVDTEHLYLAATRAVLLNRGIDLSDEDYHELFLTRSRGILHFAETYGWSQAALEAIRRERNDRYASLLREQSCVLDGVEHVLARLHGRYAMGIVTSAQREHFDIIHAASGLLRYFDFVLASGDYAEPKPHPAPYLKAVERAGVKPHECLVIEDSERGLASATAAGLKCVVVPSRLTAGRPFTAAHRVLGNIRELLPLVVELSDRAR